MNRLPWVNASFAILIASVFAGLMDTSIADRQILPNESCGMRYYDSDFPVDSRLFEHPWLVRFGYESNNSVNYVFQGVLVNKRYVLTTAFVVQFKLLGQLTYARVGEHNSSTNVDCEVFVSENETCAQPVQDIVVDAIIVHPDYDVIQQNNNIALVKLRTLANIDSPSVAPICLSNRELHTESPILLLASWCGRRETGLSLIPKQYHMKQISPYDCQLLMPSYRATMSQEMFCIVFDERHTLPTEQAQEPNLRGGGGAPVYTVHEGNKIVLLGLLSYGPRYPAKLHEPYIITSVAPFHDWIVEVIIRDLEKQILDTTIA